MSVSWNIELLFVRLLPSCRKLPRGNAVTQLSPEFLTVFGARVSGVLRSSVLPNKNLLFSTIPPYPCSRSCTLRLRRDFASSFASDPYRLPISWYLYVTLYFSAFFFFLFFSSGFSSFMYPYHIWSPTRANHAISPDRFGALDNPTFGGVPRVSFQTVTLTS
jgi:hypothetical protein